MGKTKKPRKAYRPRNPQPGANMRLQPWRLSLLFGPMERILDLLEAGETFDVDDDGEMHLHSFELGQTFAASWMIEFWIELSTLANMRALGSCPSVEPLRQLQTTLAGDDALAQADIDACRSCLMALRRYVEQMPATELHDLIRTLEMKVQMDEHDAHRQSNG